MRRHRRFRWHTIFVAALTLGLLWLFFRNVDVFGVWRAIAGARVSLIIAAILSLIPTYLLRAWRWQVLLAPIGHARFRTAFRTTVIGYTATFLLPGRVGEVLRAYLLARHERFNASSTFATIVVERLLDLSTVLLLFAVSLPLLDVDVGHQLKVAGAVAAAAAVTALITLFVLAGHPERLGLWAGKVVRFLPARAALATAQFVRTFAQGLIVLRTPGRLALSAVLSIPLWVSIAFGIWLASMAFDLTVSFVGSFLVVVFLSVGVSVPTPGGVGTFHAAYKYCVTLFFGADNDTAAAAALVLHALSFVPVSIVGLVFMWQDGLTLGRLKDMREVAKAAETPQSENSRGSSGSTGSTGSSGSL